MAQISDAALQEKAVEAWAFALAHSSFKSIRDIPPAGNPDTNEAKRGDQTSTAAMRSRSTRSIRAGSV